MTIFGLNNNYYLVNNPIYVRVTGLTGFTDLNLRISADINLNFKIFNGEVMFDIAPIVKSMMKRPSFSDILVAQGNNNIMTLGFEFWAGTDGQYDLQDMQQIIGKNFIRGGQFTGRNNYLYDQAFLKVSTSYPVWQNLPCFGYKIDGNTIDSFTIPYTPGNNIALYELRRAYGCNNAYLAFLNSLGGYSFWLFEEAEIKKSYKSKESIPNFDQRRPMDGFSDLGEKSTHKLELAAKVPKRYYGIMQSLAQSTDVWLYQPNKLIGDDFIPWQTDDWIKIMNGGNDVDVNQNKEAQKMSFDFDMKLTYDNSLTW